MLYKKMYIKLSGFTTLTQTTHCDKNKEIMDNKLGPSVQSMTST